MEIIVDDLTGPEIAEFIEEHIEEMKAVALSPESKHALDLDGLRVLEVTFWTMIEDGEILGCGAVKQLGHDHAEIKSMRVAATHRRRGLASALLRHIIAESRRMGISRLSLARPGRTRFPNRLDASISSTASSSAAPSATTRPIRTASS
jgi:putative acetyltransferase